MTSARPQLTVGALLPTVEKPAISTRQLVEYAGASGDFNRVHYDEPFVRAAGLPAVIAHGMLSAAFIGEAAARCAGAPERVTRLKFRFKALVLVEERVTVGGQVTACDDRGAELALWVKRQDGTVAVEATARLSWAAAAG